jgi:predicted NUDIX family NTP pyrophosphohydrolase
MKISAGILPYRKGERGPEVYLIRMGGPYWKKRERAWSIVKGELEEGEEPLEGAKREFREETGEEIFGRFLPLGEVKTSNKRILAWAVEAEPSTRIVSNTFTIEWPPGSGTMRSFPEAEEAAWFVLPEAKKVIVASQVPFLERLEELLSRQ